MYIILAVLKQRHIKEVEMGDDRRKEARGHRGHVLVGAQVYHWKPQVAASRGRHCEVYGYPRSALEILCVNEALLTSIYYRTLNLHYVN